MISVKNLKFLVSFFFSKKGQDTWVDNFLERKQGFLEYTKDILTQLKNLHHFSHKSEIFFIPKKGLDVLLNNVLQRKQGFLEYKRIF